MTKQVRNQGKLLPNVKPNGVRPSLLVGLGVMCLAAWWALASDEEASIQSRKNGAEVPSERLRQSEGSWKRAVVSGDVSSAGKGKNEPAESLDVVAQTLNWRTRGDLDAVNTKTKLAWSSKVPPPPPPVAPPPPPPPPPAVAPTFPYQVVGHWQETDVNSTVAVGDAKLAKRSKTVDFVVISGPSNTWVLKRGDVIEGHWRIEEISERNLRLTFLPLSQSQVISIANS